MKKKRKKKILTNLILLLALSLGVVFIIYKKTSTADLDLKAIFLSMNKKFLVYAMVSFILFRVMEAAGYYKLFSTIKVKVPFKRCMTYSLVGYLFSQLTPSGGGGQPAQLYFMTKDGIGLDDGLSTLLPFNIIYHLSLSFMGLVSLSSRLRPLILAGKLKAFFILGILAQLTMSLIIILAFKKGDFLVGVISFIAEKIKKVPFLKRFYRDKDYIRRKLAVVKSNMWTLLNRKSTFITVLIIQFFMIFFLYAVAYFTYRALGFSTYSIFDIVKVQCLITIATEFIPTPGSAGFAELAMFSGYRGLVGQDSALVWMMANRVLMVYLIVILSLLVLYKRKLITDSFEDYVSKG